MNIIKQDNEVKDLYEDQVYILNQLINHFELDKDVSLFESSHGHIANLEVLEYYDHEKGEAARLVPADIALIGILNWKGLRWIEVYKDKVSIGF